MTKSREELENELEQQADRLLDKLRADFSALGSDSSWRVARAVIHRAVHAAASGGVDFCVVAGYLAEMIPHAHGMMHGPDPGSVKHREMH